MNFNVYMYDITMQNYSKAITSALEWGYEYEMEQY